MTKQAYLCGIVGAAALYAASCQRNEFKMVALDGSEYTVEKRPFSVVAGEVHVVLKDGLPQHVVGPELWNVATERTEGWAASIHYDQKLASAERGEQPRLLVSLHSVWRPFEDVEGYKLSRTLDDGLGLEIPLTLLLTLREPDNHELFSTIDFTAPLSVDGSEIAKFRLVNKSIGMDISFEVDPTQLNEFGRVAMEILLNQ